MKSLKLFIFLLFFSTHLTAESTLNSAVNADYEYLQSLYFHLHSNPELSFQEKNTANRIATELRKAGFDTTEGVGGYGVVGILKNGEGPTLMLRTDLDAYQLRRKQD